MVKTIKEEYNFPWANLEVDPLDQGIIWRPDPLESFFLIEQELGPCLCRDDYFQGLCLSFWTETILINISTPAVRRKNGSSFH